MMITDESRLARLDLNLLIVFMVLVRERSATRAAQCLNVRQPAISNSIKRLRAWFDDPLFINLGKNGMQPTRRTLEIAEMLLPAMSIIGEIAGKD